MATLENRISALELATSFASWPEILISRYSEDDSDVIAVGELAGNITPRLPDESIEALICRAPSAERQSQAPDLLRLMPQQGTFWTEVCFLATVGDTFANGGIFGGTFRFGKQETHCLRGLQG